MPNINMLRILLVMVITGLGPRAAAHALERTLVTPHMQVAVTAGRNIVYCSTFQLAWNDMKNDIIKEDIRLEKPLELVRHLNSGRASRSDISEPDYLAMAGTGGDELVDKINRVLKEKFGPGAPQLEDKYRNSETLLAYAYLEKTLRFEEPFDGFVKPVTFLARDGKTQVDGFGIDRYDSSRHARFREQVEILDYLRHGNFVIRLNSTRLGDEIILANVPPEPTLLATYEKVKARVERGTPELLGENDALMIPKLNVSAEHSYSELLGLYLRNKGFEEYFVEEASQAVSFRLDQFGAAVDSEARFVLEKKGPVPEHKLLVFNNPFMLYVKKKDAEYPYFVLWVENEELMVSDG